MGRRVVFAAMMLGLTVGVVTPVGGSTPSDETFLVDDFEVDELPFGVAVDDEGRAALIGFNPFSAASDEIDIGLTNVPPFPVPGVPSPNTTLRADTDADYFAGFIHAFENPALDTWVSQDWSDKEGISFWMHGNGSHTEMFVDVLDNLHPDPGPFDGFDTAERFRAYFVDDVAGWQFREFPFSSFVRVEHGNGAPDDGFGLTEVRGYGIGWLSTPNSLSFYFDEVRLYGDTTPPPDTEAPTWTLPADITVTATGLDGASVIYVATASDNVGVATSSCSPPSGSSFPLGTTTVTCTAADAAGNIAASSFDVTVVVDESSTETLIEGIEDLELRNGVENSLQAPLRQASKLINDNNPDNDSAVCDKLDEFSGQVTDRTEDGSLTVIEAELLEAFAQALKIEYGCA